MKKFLSLVTLFCTAVSAQAEWCNKDFVSKSSTNERVEFYFKMTKPEKLHTNQVVATENSTAVASRPFGNRVYVRPVVDGENIVAEVCVQNRDGVVFSNNIVLKDKQMVSFPVKNNYTLEITATKKPKI